MCQLDNQLANYNIISVSATQLLHTMTFITMLNLHFYLQCILPLQPVRGNFSRVLAALNELKSLCRSVLPPRHCGPRGCVLEGLQQALAQFNRLSQNSKQVHYLGWSACVRWWIVVLIYVHSVFQAGCRFSERKYSQRNTVWHRISICIYIRAVIAVTESIYKSSCQDWLYWGIHCTEVFIVVSILI